MKTFLLNRQRATTVDRQLHFGKVNIYMNVFIFIIIIIGHSDASHHIAAWYIQIELYKCFNVEECENGEENWVYDAKEMRIAARGQSE